MLYRKVKIELREAKDRLYRVFLVRNDISLLELGCVFLSSLYASYDEDFMIRTLSNDYTLEKNHNDYHRNFLLSDSIFADLDGNFEFTYDFEQMWVFDCTVETSIIEKKGNEFAYIIDGKGEGIFENSKNTFLAYINGDIDPNSREDYLEEEYLFPYNLPIETYGDFDKYDYKQEDNYFRKRVVEDIYGFIEDLHMQNQEMDIDNIDLTEYLDDEELYDFLKDAYNLFGAEEDEDFLNTIDLIQSALIIGVEKQIKNVDYVRIVYNRLKSKYGETKTKFKIVEILLKHVKMLINGTNIEKNEDYKKELEELE